MPLIAVLVAVWVWCYVRLPRVPGSGDAHPEHRYAGVAAHGRGCGRAFVNLD